MGGTEMMIIVFAIIAFVVYYMFKSTRDQNPRPETHSEDALEILKRRYAEGKVSQEEFVRMKDELSLN
jgi:uncharacterized membrane protein